eukprot:5825694-Pleurochrysis_carterae.AAC.1
MLRAQQIGALFRPRGSGRGVRGCVRTCAHTRWRVSAFARAHEPRLSLLRACARVHAHVHVRARVLSNLVRVRLRVRGGARAAGASARLRACVDRERVGHGRDRVPLVAVAHLQRVAVHVLREHRQEARVPARRRGRGEVHR